MKKFNPHDVIAARGASLANPAERKAAFAEVRYHRTAEKHGYTSARANSLLKQMGKSKSAHPPKRGKRK